MTKRRRDLGLPILCFLFLVSRVLDVYTLIKVYWVVDREVFSPLNNLFLIIRLIAGLPIDWLAVGELSTFNAAILYFFGIKGFLLSQIIPTLVVLGLTLLIWRRGNNFAKNLVKVAIYLYTLVGTLMALANILSYQLITLDL